MRFRSIQNPPTEGNIKLDDAVRVNRALNKQSVEPKPIDEWTFVVDRKRPKSVKRQLTNQMGFLIDNGLVAEGSSLPSERELANSLKVARNVVRGAYEHLMRQGRIESKAKERLTVRSFKKKNSGSTSRLAKSKRSAKHSTSKRTAKSHSSK
ncbi:MAG TPA: GntR family transcriptional regulator [Pyrinomonadaceae bacterium]|nr:GntR family transcriptional regulator [Pyrinomonadaceae bacterium]